MRITITTCQSACKREMMCATERVLRLFLLALFSSAARAETRHAVKWTPEGVQSEGFKISVKAGDRVTFICPPQSFSTIWFITDRVQYEDCNCQSGGCILVSNCQYFLANNYTTAIQRISENLQNTPDYHPGRSYFFASFSYNITTLSNKSSARSGGECVEKMLKLEIEVQLSGDDGGTIPEEEEEEASVFPSKAGSPDSTTIDTGSTTGENDPAFNKPDGPIRGSLVGASLPLSSLPLSLLLLLPTLTRLTHFLY